MKHLKILGLAAVAAMALMAIGAGSASATTLEIGGVTQTKSITIAASATPGGAVLAKTDGSEANTCSVSSVHGVTTSYTGTLVTGDLSELSFKTCKREEVVVHSPGKLYIHWEPGTTSGEVFSEEAEVTVPTPFGFSVTCSTGAGTRIGTLDGVASTSEHAELTVSAVLNCGVFLPSATWKATYKISTPTGLGVVE